MRIAIGCVAVCLILLTGASEARHYYVKPDSTGTAINIQAGIDLCRDGDSVIVSPGWFRGEGNRNLDFKGKDIVVIAESRIAGRSNLLTIIDCEGKGRGFNFHSGETRTAIVEGFIIKNGQTLGAGGGVLCDSTSCPTIRGNIFRYCKANCGGAACCNNSSPLIEDNKMFHNADFKSLGSAIDFYNSSAVIVNNEICCNVIYAGTAGLRINACSLLTIENNDLYFNMHGAVDIFHSKVILRKNRIYYNTSGFEYGYGAVNAFYAEATIADNEIFGNEAGPGCAIYSFSSKAIIENNFIHHNGDNHSPTAIILIELNASHASRISGNTISDNHEIGILGCYSTDSCEIVNNTIFNNYTIHGAQWRSEASVIICKNASPLIKNNIIASNRQARNKTYSSVGLISCYSSSPVIENNTITDNVITGDCVVYVNDLSNPIISNNIICNNIVTEDCNPQWFNCTAAGIRTENPSIKIFSNNIYGNKGASYIGIPDPTGVNGNISVDPMFCDPENGEYSLNRMSPCLPGNHPSGEDWGLIGALGEGCDYIADSQEGVPDSPLTLYQNFPNPFNPSTSIRYYLPQRSNVVLDIYDAAGKRVTRLHAGHRDEGMHVADWDGRDAHSRAVSSGVYFCRLTAEKQSLSQKMILLR